MTKKIILKPFVFMALICAIMPFFKANAQFYYNEPGRNSSGLFTLKGDAFYTSGNGDNPGDGWLRLTPRVKQKFGYTYSDKTFPSSMGVTIEFDFKVYGTDQQYSYTDADGFCVFLIDEDRLSGQFQGVLQQGGARGGGLGYASNVNTQGGRLTYGMKPVFLGIGIDEYGNFSQQVVGIDAQGITGGRIDGPGQRAQSIAIREGDQNSYKYIDGTGPDLDNIIYNKYYTPGVNNLYDKWLSYNFPNATSRPGNNTYYRRIKVDINPVENKDSTFKIDAYLKAREGDAFIKLITKEYRVPSGTNIPSRFRLGFSATTGEYLAIHEVRDIIARTPGEFQVIKKLPDNITTCLSSNLSIITVVTSELEQNKNNIVIRDTLPSGYTVIGVPNIPDANKATSRLTYTTQKTVDGRDVYVYDMDFKAFSTLEITYNGRFTTPPLNGMFYSAARITGGYTNSTGKGLYSRLDGQLSDFITRVSPTNRVKLYDKKNIPDDNLEVQASAGASLQWQYMTGAGWTNTGNSTTTLTPKNVAAINTLLQEGKSVFIRCLATWDASHCTQSDAVDFVYTSYPDNVLDPECYVEAPRVAWTFKEAAISPAAHNIHNYISPLAGNIDDDDAVEIIVSAAGTVSGSGNEYKENKVYIYKGNSDLSLYRELDLSTVQFYTKQGAPYAIAKYNNIPYLVVAGYDRYLHAYDLKTGNKKWDSDNVYCKPYNGTVLNLASPSFADFNADGKPEIYIGGSIFDIEGKLIISSPGNTGKTFMDKDTVMRTVAADVDNDGFLEYVAGNEVYSVDVAQKKMTLKYTISGASPAINSHQVTYGDGQTQVVDWDGDGILDIVVSYTNSTGRIFVYIWNAVTENVIAYYASDWANGDILGTNRAFSSISIPMLGDLEGDGLPDMVFVTQKRLNILKHDAASANKMKYSYQESTDASGFTGATLFDFNLDGISELVYRDETDLRIMNLSGKSHITGGDTIAAYNLVKLPSRSGTWGEYPIVVDADGDGAAEIVSIGADTGSDKTGRLRIYKSADPDSPWASARKVWNQYAYNPVYVNEDLTIPSIPLNQAIRMDGKPGTSGIQPFNNFLQQATKIDMRGVPFWLTPRAEHGEDPVFDYFEDGDSLHIYLKIVNTGTTSFYSPFYISTFRKDGSVFTFIKDDSIMQKIDPNQAVEKRISLKNIKNYGVYDSIVVRLNNKNGYAQLQCEYTKNSNGEPVWKIKHLNPDYQSVQKYYSINVDVLGNDEVPTGFFPRDFSLKDSVTIQPKAGTLYTSGTGSSSKLLYVSDGRSLTNSIDSFQYRLYFQNSSSLPARPYTAWAYIYTLEDVNGAVRCAGTDYTIKPVYKPQGIKFDWTINGASYNNPGTVTVKYNFTLNSCKIKPVDVAHFGNKFPEVDYKLNTVTPASGSMIQMRWTGDFDTNWMNPANWALITAEGGRQIERPAQSPPSTCMDVIIPSSVDNYPEITDSAYINNILMKDRSMIKNPQRLNYNQAAVELKFKPSEFDRFVMLSAPLQGMTSGDYSYTIKNQTGSKGDVFMSLFQQKSPDDPNTSVTKNHFTATFGKTDLALEPGMGFNVNVRSTTMNRDSLMRFPHGANTGAKFITHSMTALGSNMYELPVIRDIPGSDIVQVVNPYMAYLNLGDFLNSNSADLKSGYYIWNGELKSGFTTVMMNSDKHIVVAGNPDSWMDTQTNVMIAPMQSFFVAKRNSASTLSKLKISPDWTSTKNGSGGNYTLRAENAAKINGPGTLRIKLSQEGKSAFAALVYDHSASPFVESNDMPVIIYDELPLSVYTLAVTREPLYINTDGMFCMFNLPLGLRAKDAEETKLEFTGLETFGHDVTLIDKQLNRSIDLQKTPEYTFTLKKTNSSTLELNDRFELNFSYTGKGLGTGTEGRPEAQPVLKVSATNGHIEIVSNKGNISSLHIYDTGGKLVYGTSELDRDSFSMQATKHCVYIIKALVDGKFIVEKVIAK